MLVLDPWDALAVVGLVLVLGGAAAAYWPLALILGGGLLLGAYCVREYRHVSQPTAPADQPDPAEPE